MIGGDQMQDRPTTSEDAVDAQIDQIVSDTTHGSSSPTTQAPRDALDTQESLIHDAVLRMGSLVEEAIRRASRALETHDASLALEFLGFRLGDVREGLDAVQNRRPPKFDR